MKPKTISSDQNQSFKNLRKLLTGRGIQEQELALIAGDKVVPEVVSQCPGRIAVWITSEVGPPPPCDVPWVALAQGLFDELDQFGTRQPLLAVRVSPFQSWADEEPWPQGCTLFLGFQNPENVGAIVRSAVAFGVSRIVLLKEAAHPFLPKSMRAAGTALMACKFQVGPSIHELRVGQVPLFSLDAAGGLLSDQVFPERFALLPGVEGPGVPTGVSVSSKLRIPMDPGIESLNAATATAIALYEWRRKVAK